ncbi:MAG: tetratricopeptide repeat protein [Treponema sp.]|jgi:tetratricopeptide (TPR) repeat protein|nr:tetratricopeptide repeat protein [Treponema sp.]
MKKLKDFLIAILILAAVGLLIYFLYERGSTRTNRELAKRMIELSPRGGPPEGIDGLRRAIALYEDQIERNVREGAQTGVYWKILGTRLADKGQHRDALEAFERAIYYNSEDPFLYYYTGVSAAVVAKEIVGFSANAEAEKARFYKLSENSYLRALELDITYTRPMYGLGILYVFELDRPQDAVVQLERYMQIITSDYAAMFVLARAYYDLKDFSRATEIYDRIAERAKDKNIKEEALRNKDIIQERLYE